MSWQVRSLLLCFLPIFAINCGSDTTGESNPSIYQPNNNNSGDGGGLTDTMYIQGYPFTDCHGDFWEQEPGNCDGIINPKEKIDMDIVLRNDTYSDLTGVWLEVSSSDPSVVIKCQNFDYGTIFSATSKEASEYDNVGDPCVAEKGMRFEYTELIDAKKVVKFDITIYSDQGTLNGSFEIEVEKTGADLILDDYQLIDYTYNGSGQTKGNGNQILDPGETVGLSLTVKNEGKSSTQKVRGELGIVEGKSCVGIEAQKINFEDWLDNGNSATAEYDPGYPIDNGARLVVAADCSAGTKIVFNLLIYDMYGNGWEQEFSLYVGKKPDVCTSNCAEKECGDDGCGDSCGSCGNGYNCQNSKCAKESCQPNCLGKECGDDDCGGSCGNCSSGYDCINGICQQQICTPDCGNKQCGNDGCGGSCGSCGSNETCIDGKCIKNPAKYGEYCGDNIPCEDGLTCFSWIEVGGTYLCGKHCQNDNECLGTCCGPYAVGDQKVCMPLFLDSGTCAPCNCIGKECGDNGCGGQCGDCGIYPCYKGKCVDEFIDTGYGTIEAVGTDLIWAKSVSEPMDISDAGEYCDWATIDLPQASNKDWVVPSFEDLQSLLLKQPVGACYIDPIFQIPGSGGFPACDWYWSDSYTGNCGSYPPFPAKPYHVVNFNVGYSDINCCPTCYFDRVRCVQKVIEPLGDL